MEDKKVSRMLMTIRTRGQESQSYVDDDNEPEGLLSPTFRWKPSEELNAFA